MNGSILVVDDSSLVRRQVKGALLSAGFDVIEAVDGLDALQKTTSGKISLVVCDVNMPRMSGLQFLTLLRQTERGKKVPVVILTTNADQDLVMHSQSLGAKGFILKPFKPELIVATARKLTQSEH